MKRFLLLLTLIMGFSIINCSSNDESESNEQNDENTTNEDLKLLKKVEHYRNGLFFDKTIIYDSTDRIVSIIVNKYQAGPFYSSISVEYADGLVSSIVDSIDYENPIRVDKYVNYDVTIGEDLLALVSEDTAIEITHSNDFVDTVIEYSLDNSSILKSAYLQRDSLDNLTSITFSNGNVVNSYSDFDSDKKLDPASIVLDLIFIDYYRIFGLKLTANNPRTSMQSINGSQGNPQTFTYEYDDEGYIIKTIDPNLVFYTDSFYVD